MQLAYAAFIIVVDMRFLCALARLFVSRAQMQCCMSPIVADSMLTSVYRGTYNECNKCTRLTVRIINLPRRSRRRHRHRVACYAGIDIGDLVGVSRLTCCGCLILLSVCLYTASNAPP